MIENLAEFYERIGRSDLAAEAYIKDKPYFTVQDSACRIGMCRSAIVISIRWRLCLRQASSIMPTNGL